MLTLLTLAAFASACSEGSSSTPAATGGAGASAGAAGATNGGAAGEAGSGPVIIPSIPHDGPWRIMPLGDSITGTTCYPKLLSELLIEEGRTNFEFVGSVLNNQSCSGAPNVQTEGHGGYLVTALVGSGEHATEPAGWFSAASAEVVLMHFGTNDVWSNLPTQDILDAYSELVAGMRAVTPDVIVFVAQIIPLAPTDPGSACAMCMSRVEDLNAEIPGWAAGLSTDDSPIYAVDQFTGFYVDTDTADGVHPNLAGAQKMADAWWLALGSRGIP